MVFCCSPLLRMFVVKLRPSKRLIANLNRKGVERRLKAQRNLKGLKGLQLPVPSMWSLEDTNKTRRGMLHHSSANGGLRRGGFSKGA